MKVGNLKEIFDSLPAQIDREAAEEMDAVYQFDLRGTQAGQYQLLVQNGTCAIKEGSHADPHVTLSMSGEDCIRVLTGQLSGMTLAMSGRLQIAGDIELAMRLKSLFPDMGR